LTPARVVVKVTDLALAGLLVGQGVLRRNGIRDRPRAPRSPWQSGHVERLIGSIRRECLDHFVVFDEAHLRPLLKAYASYYNEVRTHLSLNKDAPDFRRFRSFCQAQPAMIVSVAST
jgi:transposase InsO family protein